MRRGKGGQKAGGGDESPAGKSAHSLAKMGPSGQSDDSRSMAKDSAIPAARVPAKSRDTVAGVQPRRAERDTCDPPTQAAQSRNRASTLAPESIPGGKHGTFPSVNNSQATVAEMADASQLNRRYLRLIEELYGEEGKDHGADASVARRLGVSPSLLSRIASGGRKVGVGTLLKTAQAMRLRPSYFFDFLEPRSYRDYQRKRYEALEEFLATPLGKSASPAERAILESMDFQGARPTPANYHAVLVGLRGSGLPDDVLERATSESNAVDEASKKTKKTT